MSQPIRWGILGSGFIANRFAADLSVVDDAELVAVGSRSLERAEQLVGLHGGRAHAGYPDLAADGDVDVVYVATPNAFHLEHCLLAIEAGKHVLCEKPFAMDAAQAGQIVDAARSAGVFCMEAMWLRTNPLIQQLRELVAGDAIGRMCVLDTSIGFSNVIDPTSRFFDPDLGGGALLDLGVYGVSLAYFLMGRPETIMSRAHIGSSGVDEDAVVVLGYDDGIASIACSVRASGNNEATLMGTKGHVVVGGPVFNPTTLHITERRPRRSDGGGPVASAPGRLDRLRVPEDVTRWVRHVRRMIRRDDDVVRLKPRGTGMEYEAEEVVRAIRAGETESPLMPLDESVQIMETLDAIRGQWPGRG